MPESVFWDTAAFVALGNADGELHDQAVEISQALARRNSHILTTSAVLTEVANKFSWQLSRQRNAFGHDVLVQAKPTLSHPIPSLLSNDPRADQHIMFERDIGD